MSTRRIRLTRYATVAVSNYKAYRLRVEVTAVEGPDIDSNIFVYRRNPASPYTQQSTDTFEAVAGPPQLAAIPAGEPDPDQSWPFYRLPYVELDVISTAQADAIWNEIQAEACELVESLDRLTQLQAIQDVWCPSPPDPSSFSSQSV
jgi:hypothetical protein